MAGDRAANADENSDRSRRRLRQAGEGVSDPAKRRWGHQTTARAGSLTPSPARLAIDMRERGRQKTPPEGDQRYLRIANRENGLASVDAIGRPESAGQGKN